MSHFIRHRLFITAFLVSACTRTTEINFLSTGLTSAPTPGTFSFLSAKPGAGLTELNWNSASGATTYTVRYGTTSGVYNSVASTSATSPYVVQGLTPGVTYYFMASANNGSGERFATSEISAVPATTIVGSFSGAIGNFASSTGLVRSASPVFGVMVDTLGLRDLMAVLKVHRRSWSIQRIIFYTCLIKVIIGFQSFT